MTLELFAVQVGHYPTYNLAEIGTTFNAVKFVLMADEDLWTCADYIDQCHEAGLKAWGIVARESMTTETTVMSPEVAAGYYAARCPKLDYLTVLNEADGDPTINHESWCLTPQDARDILRPFRAAFANTSVLLAAVGTVAGDGDWVKRLLRLSPYPLEGYAFLDNHAYAQWPDTVADMLSNYDSAGMWKVIGEFGWDHPDPATRGIYIRDMTRRFDTLGMASASVYCWHKRQGGNFYVWDDNGPTNAIRYIQELGYRAETPHTVPPIVVPGDGHIGSGFRTWQAREPDLLGTFDEPAEYGAKPGISQIRTTRGVLTWADLKDQTPVLTFYDWGHKTRHVWQEDWPRSQHVDATP